MTAAQRQAKRRAKLIEAASELDQLKKQAVCAPSSNARITEIIALLDGSTDQDLELISKILKDKQRPSQQALDGLYQGILSECIRKNINDAISADIEALYIFASNYT